MSGGFCGVVAAGRGVLAVVVVVGGRRGGGRTGGGQMDERKCANVLVCKAATVKDTCGPYSEILMPIPPAVIFILLPIQIFSRISRIWQLCINRDKNLPRRRLPRALQFCKIAFGIMAHVVNFEEQLKNKTYGRSTKHIQMGRHSSSETASISL